MDVEISDALAEIECGGIRLHGIARALSLEL